VGHHAKQEAFGIDQQMALAPHHTLVPIEAAHAAHERLDRLAVNDGGAGRGIPAGMQPRQLAQLAMDLSPRLIKAPSRRHWRKYQETVCQGPYSRGRERPDTHAHPVRRRE
jgi:hypothetical protein